MKKVRTLVSTILVSAMLVTLVGCGDGKDKGVSNSTNKSQTEQGTNDNKDNKQDDKKSSYQKDPDLGRTLELGIGLVTFEIDVPTGWGGSNQGTGWGYTDLERELYVIYDTYLEPTSRIRYEVNLENIKSADQVVEGMEKQFLSTGMCLLPLSKTEDYEIIKKENVKVNEWDMCRYEGKFILEDNPRIQIKDKKAHFVAYTVIKDGYPIYFVVVDESDAQEQAAVVGELADKIAKTFREYGQD